MNEPAKPKPTEADLNLAMRRQVGRILVPTLLITLLFLVFFVVAMFRSIPGEVQSGSINDSPTEQMFLRAFHTTTTLRVMQVSAGLTLGYSCICLGAVMCWFGIAGPFKVDAGQKLTIQATHIGLVLLVGGMILIGFALTIRFQMQTTAISPDRHIEEDIKRIPVAPDKDVD